LLDMLMNDFDAIGLFEAQAAGERDAARLEERYGQVTRRVFNTPGGREWLGLVMARMNYMGSVFSSEDGMDAIRAAHRDGMRAVVSDILNSAVGGQSAE